MTHVILKKNPDSFWVEPGDQWITTRSWGSWHLVQKRYLVWNTRRPSRDGYEVDLWEIDSHKELIDWLFHVGGKNMDPSHFFEAMKDIFHSAGFSSTVDGKALTIEFWEQSVPHRKGLHDHT